jgi:hypothetical protein
MKGITGFRLRRDWAEAKRRDNFTPIFFAVCATVFSETLAIGLLHSDPDVHPINFVLLGLLVFGIVGAAVYDNVNG